MAAGITATTDMLRPPTGLNNGLKQLTPIDHSKLNSRSPSSHYLSTPDEYSVFSKEPFQWRSNGKRRS